MQPPEETNPFDATLDPDAPPTQSPVTNRRRVARFDLPGFTELDGGASSTRSCSPEPLHTPTLGESYHGLRKNLSFKSLRELEFREVQEAVWRKGTRDEPGAPKHRPKNLEEVFAHAVRGGFSELLPSTRHRRAPSAPDRALTSPHSLHRVACSRWRNPRRCQLGSRGSTSDQKAWDPSRSCPSCTVRHRHCSLRNDAWSLLLPLVRPFRPVQSPTDSSGNFFR